MSTDSELQEQSTQKENLTFQTEVSKLLHLMIHSLYSNSDIFLRELVSNASDALDKLRFESLSNSKLMENDSELAIQIDFDAEKNTLTIADNGIGMSKEDVINHLGTIAKSGTSEFLQKLSGEQQKDTQLIGQFGVGFYSAFMVADRIEVFSRHAGLPAEEAAHWESEGEGGFSIETTKKSSRGTTIILHLKSSAKEYADGFKLRTLIRQYSDHIASPIKMQKEKPPETDKETDENIIDIPEYEIVNTATALWTRSRQEIPDEEYNEFYKHISHDFEDPLIRSHNKVEGKLEYTSLLYIPKKAPFDLWNRDAPRGLKLYIQRVFIMDNAEKFLPLYLRFVKGVIDCKDLPLNVSREILQDDASVEKIRSALTKRVLGMLENLMKEDKEAYAGFWQTFGQVIKEGVAEDHTNKERIAKLLRFSTTFTDKETQDQSLDDYLTRMQPEQDKIYYISAENFNTAKNSPHLEIFRKKGIEAILLYDRIDEWVMNYLAEYDGKSLKDITRGDLDFGKLADEATGSSDDAKTQAHEELTKRVKQALESQVADVKVTHRLTNSPACITIGEQDMSMQMRQIMAAAGQALPEGKPIFELNPDHGLIKRLEEEADEANFAELAMILFEQAQLAEGAQLDDPTQFITRLNAFLLKLI